MRYAIISDVHSNLEAFEVALNEIDRLGVDRIVSLGDIVGYNANPNECIELIIDRKIPTIMGNHDAVACGREDPVTFNPIARSAILWTRETLTPDYQDFLQQQSEQSSLSDTIRLVHGSLLDRDQYLLAPNDMMENIQQMRKASPEIQILFFGHTHYQMAIPCNNDLPASPIPSLRFTLQEDTLYLINPGSVGQPRNQDPRCQFLVYDDDDHTVEFIRVSYNIHACAQKVLAVGLPRELADRLHQGW